jgi:hypothetical protein
MAILVLCDRCGAMAPRGHVAGHCSTCAPHPQDLGARQREVDKRHLKAVEDAAESRANPVEVPERRPTVPKPRARLDALWRLVVHRKETPAHLFAPGFGPTPSLCGLVDRAEASDLAPSGMRGCRRCALAAGWIESLSESVTT